MVAISKKTTGGPIMLALENISVLMSEKVIIQDINLQFKPGKMVALCGPNGAGKSTLLKVISGEIKPSSGVVMWEDKPLNKWKPIDIAKVRGKLSQESQLSFPFTVREVVEMGRYPYKNDNETEKTVRKCLESVDLYSMIERRYDTLSGGEKQRVHLARVLAQLTSDDNPKQRKILLLDEPTSALDLKHQKAVLKLAHLLTQQNYLVVVVLHDLNLAAAWADSVVLLKNGTIKGEGTVQEMLTEEMLEQVYDVSVSVMEHPSSIRPFVSISRDF